MLGPTAHNGQSGHTLTSSHAPNLRPDRLDLANNVPTRHKRCRTAL